MMIWITMNEETPVFCMSWIGGIYSYDQRVASFSLELHVLGGLIKLDCSLLGDVKPRRRLCILHEMNNINRFYLIKYARGADLLCFAYIISVWPIVCFAYKLQGCVIKIRAMATNQGPILLTLICFNPYMVK